MRLKYSCSVLLLVMALACDTSAYAANSKTMQFSLSSNTSSKSVKSASGWDVASADTDGPACQVSKYVGNGAFMTLSAHGGDYSLSVANSRDQFDVWKDYPVVLTADGHRESADVRPSKFDTVVMPVANIDAFRKAHSFDIAVGERHYSFTEAKMGKVVAKLDHCAGISVSSSHSSGSSDSDFAQMSPAAGTTPAAKPAASTASSTTTSSTSSTTTGADGSTTATTTTTTTDSDVPADDFLTEDGMGSPDVGDTAVPMPSSVPSPNLATVPAAPAPLDAAVQTVKDAAATGANPALDATSINAADAAATPAPTLAPAVAMPAVPAAAPAAASATVTPTDLGTTPAPAANTPVDALPSVTAAPAPVVPAVDAATAASASNATAAPTALTDTATTDAAKAADVKVAEKKADVKPVVKKKAKAKAKAPVTPATADDALSDGKSSLTYKPIADKAACPAGQTCPVVPADDILAAKAAQSPLKEQDVGEVKSPPLPMPVPLPVATPALVGESCTSSDEYKNLVRKIGLLETEKEKLRVQAGTADLTPTLQKVAQCASESYQIKELRTELDIVKKENADLRRQAEAVKGADNLNDALNELDETVKNGKK